jgi:fatty acyl-CoA reductase
VIEEKIHPYAVPGLDFEQHIKNILEADPEDIVKNQRKYLFNHENAYVFTKDSVERYLERYRGNLRLVINRPSLIINCAREPIVGWCDSIAGAGGVVFPAAIGVSRNFHLNNVKMDFIPADICTNSILVTTAYAG